MFRVKHSTMILISGSLWSAIGLLLMWKGLNYLMECASNFQAAAYPLVTPLVSVVGGVQEAVLLLIFCALVVGYVKGKFVLGKSAKRGLVRITTLPNPGPLYQIYSPPYLLLYAFMMSMGMIMKFTGCPEDIRGLIDTAVGSALINGAMIYFRAWVGNRNIVADC